MTEVMLVMVGIVAGVLLGGIGGWVMVSKRMGREREEAAMLRPRVELLQAQQQELRAESERWRSEAKEANQLREGALREAAELKVRAEEQSRQLVERERLLKEAEAKLTAAFESAGARALRANNEAFLSLAKEALGAVMTEAKGDVEKRQQAITATLEPIKGLLERQATAIGELEKRRIESQAGLAEQLRALSVASEKLTGETGRLVTALRRPDVRGRWGEIQLRNAVELAGMTAYCDFEEQVTVAGEDGMLRPDMVVRLPGGGRIVVDSKVALDAYLEAIEPGMDRESALERHADQVESHVKRLSQKRYWEEMERSPRLVVMFMPLESALVAALERRPQLQESAMRADVLLCTPILLVALLRAIAYGWRQEDVSRNAAEIQKAGAELYERLATFVKHFEAMGDSLKAATRSYNAGVGSLESRLIVSARRIRELNATDKEVVETPPLIEIEPRGISASELRAVEGNE